MNYREVGLSSGHRFTRSHVVLLTARTCRVMLKYAGVLTPCIENRVMLKYAGEYGEYCKAGDASRALRTEGL